MAKTKKTNAANTGEDVGDGEPACTAGVWGWPEVRKLKACLKPWVKHPESRSLAAPCFAQVPADPSS